MNDVVIRAEGLGKRYLIGHQSGERYTALRDVLARTAKDYVRSFREMLKGRELVEGDAIEEFWALRDVGFEIRRGDVVGVIGRNGAGKSTLLKILSRITEPSAGHVEIRGRVASLLEVGTGFHPELSGRENIFLNGAILGMSRTEIRRKFDEIVAFAEVEQFLDTPVKRFSSGMYVRLAFAVAAHLEPEILVVDEVLAVGDAEFQRKCLGKMGEVAGHGRTVLFVSHNIGAVRQLCSTGLFLDGGRVLQAGSVSSVVDAYQQSLTRPRAGPRAIRGPTGGAYIRDLVATPAVLLGDAELELSATIVSDVAFSGVVNLFFVDHERTPVGALSVGGMGAARPIKIEPGSTTLILKVFPPRLARGLFSVDVELADKDRQLLCRLEDVVSFATEPAPRADETEVLNQGWGFGNVWFEHRIVNVAAQQNESADAES